MRYSNALDLLDFGLAGVIWLLEILVECWLLVGGSEIIGLVMVVVVIGTGKGKILVVGPIEP